MRTSPLFQTRAAIIVLLFSFTFPHIARAQAWTQKADHPDCRYDGVTFAIDGLIYYGAGITCAGVQSNTFRSYDPAMDTWSTIAPLPNPTRRIAGAFAVGGKGYVVGGIPQDGFAIDEVREYDPAADSWTQKSDFPGGARGAFATMVANGKAYLCGGLSYMVFYQDMWEYEPGADTWTQKQDFPGGYIMQASGFSIGSDCYVVFGKDNDLGIFNDLWKYDTQLDTWTQKADHPGPGRTNASAFALNGKGYAGFGANGTDWYGDFYSYDPSADAWTAVVSIPGAPSFYDGTAATATAGYCIMRSASEPETWEFSLGTSAVGGMNDDAVPFRVTSTSPGLLTVVSGPHTSATTVALIAANGQVVGEHSMEAGSTWTCKLPSGLYCTVMWNGQARRTVVRAVVQ